MTPSERDFLLTVIDALFALELAAAPPMSTTDTN